MTAFNALTLQANIYRFLKIRKQKTERKLRIPGIAHCMTTVEIR